MQKAALEGRHMGRNRETPEEFIAKSQSQNIITFLKSGASLRGTAELTQTSINTVRKVARALAESEDKSKATEQPAKEPDTVK